MTDLQTPFEIRPNSNLRILYAIYIFFGFLFCLVFGLGFILGFLYLFLLILVWAAILAIRYYTLNYKFTDEGIEVKVGWIFKKENYLNYNKIQDIHLSQNLFERFLKIGTIKIQNASAGSGADQRIEGIKNFVEIRELLYGKIGSKTIPNTLNQVNKNSHPSGIEEVLKLLNQISKTTKKLADK